MKIEVDKSIICDVINFLDISFNKSIFEEEYKEYNFNKDISFHFFDHINKINVDKALYAFVKRESNQKCLLKRFYISIIDEIKSFDEFIQYLSTERFYSAFVDEYFDSKNTDFKSQIFDSCYDKNLSASLIYIIIDYKKSLDVLCNELKKIFTKVTRLFSINSDIIENFKLSIEGKKSWKVYLKKE